MPSPMPPEVRKQLLLARCAVERAELTRALDRFRESRAPFERIARLASGPARSSAFGSLGSVLGFVRGHPYLGTAVSRLAGTLRGTAAGRWVVRGLVVAGAAGAGLWLLRTAPSSGAAGSRDISGTNSGDEADAIGPIDG